MKSKFLKGRLATAQVLLCALAVILGATSAQAGEKVIFAFNGTQGINPSTGLVSDGAGNFYGTVGGGIGNCSNVYELSPNSDGTYAETILYTFQNCTKTGNYPIGTLSPDKNGNLYGALYGFDAADGSGVIYELLKQTNGTFAYRVLHNFGADEGGPYGDFAWDGAGNMYGATSHDSTTFSGEVFELSPQSNGTWKESVLVQFPTSTGVGSPVGSVVLDGQGNLYGATFFGTGGYGSNTRGGVYELSPQAGGSWKFTLLYNFTPANKSQFPNSRLTFDSSGDLYGTAQGSSFYGSVFEVSPSSSGVWTATTLHSFSAGTDGADTTGNLVFDANGNLYGVTYDGGSGCNRNLCGVVYKLTPQSGGGYTESIEHPFESASDGSIPESTLLLGNDGNLYGTTYHGGSRYGYGTVYQITP
jgi:uncharacterized repeat protein (TIGR03803 family)